MTPTTSKKPANIKAQLALPLIIVPFACLLFYVLGGGKADAAETEEKTPKGLNTFLPSPQIKDTHQDKLSLYQSENRDSVHHQRRAREGLGLFDRAEPLTEATANDEETTDNETQKEGSVSSPFSAGRSSIKERLNGRRQPRHREPADQLEEKLLALQQSLREAEQPPTPPTPVQTSSTEAGDKAVMQQIEAAMAAIQQNGAPGSVDPELGKMDGMLDKILDIQHPTRVRDRAAAAQPAATKGMRVAPVDGQRLIAPLIGVAPAPAGPAQTVSAAPIPQKGFFELSDPELESGAMAPAIAAVVHETQTLVSGSTLKIRLLQDVYVNNQLIPKGAFIFGRCGLSGERLQITFTAIRHGQLLFPVNLVAYALDGIPGIRIPGSITKDAAKAGSNEAIQAIGMTTLDPSLGAQATAAGIDVAKTLLTKRVKLVKVTIKADFPLLLKDGTSQASTN